MAVDLPRDIALKILYDINEKDAYSNIALNKYLEGNTLKDIDRAFITEIVYGTVKWRLKIDWVIRSFSSVRLKKISPWILNILRLGVYQLLFTTKVPESAACNESVNLAKKYGHQASTGFVNALMRNIAKSKDSIAYPDKNGDKVQYLSVKYSHPEWMVSRFMNLFGEEFTESLLNTNNGIPQFTVRVNTLKTSRDRLIESLAAQDIEAYPGKYSKDSLIIKNPSSVTRLEAFKNGSFQVQDESSMLVAQVLDPQPEEFIVDACSAPGGKATHIAQLMGNKGIVLARDIHEHKIKLIDDAARRLGTSIVNTEIFDASTPDYSYEGRADRVLLDAPCSGLGIIRKKPDIKWAKDIDDEKGITELQLKLINNVSKLVKPGGVLVYSTCTIIPEENQDIIRNFIKTNVDF
jgi:16S rRNA (cytosine967-C5)-methyltransferase